MTDPWEVDSSDCSFQFNNSQYEDFDVNFRIKSNKKSVMNALIKHRDAKCPEDYLIPAKYYTGGARCNRCGINHCYFLECDFCMDEFEVSIAEADIVLALQKRGIGKQAAKLVVENDLPDEKVNKLVHFAIQLDNDTNLPRRTMYRAIRTLAEELVLQHEREQLESTEALTVTDRRDEDSDSD